MILYHGSNIEITDVDLSKCRPYKDFGQGFYLTSIREQALKMAQRVSRIYGNSPCITEFEFDKSAYSDKLLHIKRFETPSKEWALFVINNRSREFRDIASMECNHDLKYDIVSGPIADDDLALLFRQFSNGMITVDTLVENMEYKKLTDQFSFHSKKALSNLKKVGVHYD